MDRDAIWRELLAEAIKRSPCVDASSTCWLVIRHLPWYATFQHKDNAEHACGLCNPEVPPTHIVSVQTLQTVRREVLVARLALFLSHAHEYPATSGTGADRDAVDGDAPTAPGNPTSVSSDAAGTGASCSDRAAA